MGAGLLGLVASPVCACTVGPATPGLLGTLPQGSVYGSDLGGGPAVLTVTNIYPVEPAYRVTVGAPAITGWGSGFNPNSATVQIAYTAVGTGVSYTQDFTSSASGFNAPATAIAVVMTFQSRIITSAGFATGDYATKVTVTCG